MHRDVVIIGGGRFGRLALERLGDRVLALVEPSPADDLAALCGRHGAGLMPGDGAAVLQGLISDPGLAWIVPTLPRHLLMDWLCLELESRRPAAASLDPGILPDLPSLSQGPEGQLYVSLADFRCPDDCPAPADRCHLTGRPRGLPLHRRLADLRPPGRAVAVLASRQLAPGVGGLARMDMLDLRDRLAAGGDSWMIGTACRCHGVLHGLDLHARRSF